jgi:hypothetical protein
MDRFDFLARAKELTAGDRNRSYGAPYTNHDRIARLWSDYLGFQLKPEQVAICMVLLKVARLMERSGSEATDTFVDLTAYSAIAGELSLIEEERHLKPILPGRRSKRRNPSSAQ